MVIHDQAIKQLSAADYHLIEKEHAQLERFLSDLDATCCNLNNSLDCQHCGTGKLASCRGRLPSFMHHVVELADKHFYHEESIMLSRPNVTEDYSYFRIHQQAHEDIMKKLIALRGECALLDSRGNTAEGYRQFYKNLSHLLEEHDRNFDDPFIQSTKA
jgi:hemerythrin